MEVNAAERQIEFNGVKLSETKWAQCVGLPLSAVKTRIHRGWSIQDALTTPLHTAPSEILVPPGPSIAYVALNDGKFALIDSDTIPLVQGRSWFAVKDPKSGRRYPATHRIVDGKPEFLSMRTLVLGTKPRTSYAMNMNNLDCRAANLRDVSKTQPSWRNAKRSNNKTGYTGVSRNKEKKRFIARLQTNGVHERIGSFKRWKKRLWRLIKLLFGYKASLHDFNKRAPSNHSQSVLDQAPLGQNAMKCVSISLQMSYAR